jgi:hypothetical protein
MPKRAFLFALSGRIEVVEVVDGEGVRTLIRLS